jgi:hypothetical protein
MIDVQPYIDHLNRISDGWEDSYWHNDACQSIAREYSEDSRLKVWIDSLDPSEREYDHGGQFILVRENDDSENEVLLITDNWQAVATLVSQTD